MNWFPQRPLGAAIPNLLHAVSCSLPTMRDVIGYEEKDPTTVAQMSSGYPRFVVHPMLGAVEKAWREQYQLTDETALWIVSSRRMAERLAKQIAPERAQILEHDGVHGVAHQGDAELRKRAKAFLQHTGGFLSSRQAEDYASEQGLVIGRAHEKSFQGDAPHEIRRTVTELLDLDASENVLLASSGMNAFWASFLAIGARQRARGRDIWLQLGWLYLDTSAILEKFSRDRVVTILDVHDQTAIEAAFRTHGARIAAVVTEVPTNPLLQTPDLPRVAALAREHGTLMVVDPTIASLYSVDVLPYSDLVLASLTKHAASDGDVIAGMVAVTSRCPDRADVKAAIAAELEPVYPRDLARLAEQIRHYSDFVANAQASAAEVVRHLTERGRGLRHVYWSLQDDSRQNYLTLARMPERIAPMVSFEVDGDLTSFYDAVPLAKGPSFGMRTSLLCPYSYLAHYDLVSTAEGRKKLAAAKMPVNLLRLSIGDEPADEIIAALEVGFAAAGC